jgi:hypothetical protein
MFYTYVWKCFIRMLYMFHTYVASILSGYCIYFATTTYMFPWCFIRMLQVFHLDVAKVDLMLHMLKWDPSVTTTCYSCWTHMHVHVRGGGTTVQAWARSGRSHGTGRETWSGHGTRSAMDPHTVVDPPIWRGLAAARPSNRRDYPLLLSASQPCRWHRKNTETNWWRRRSNCWSIIFTRVLDRPGMLLGLYTGPHEGSPCRRWKTCCVSSSVAVGVISVLIWSRFSSLSPNPACCADGRLHAAWPLLAY